jgi:hypothetical protein
VLDRHARVGTGWVGVSQVQCEERSEGDDTASHASIAQHQHHVQRRNPVRPFAPTLQARPPRGAVAVEPLQP